MHAQTIIAITNEKGGTAKTTTAVSLSAALGELGQRVLLVDLDGQAATSRWLGVEEDSRLSEAMAAGGGLEPIRDVLPGVSLVPASGKLDSIAHDLRPTQGGQLRKVLVQLEGFDFIFIDCPPSLGNRLIANALLAATHAIVPVETSILALDGLKILLTTLEDVREGFGHSLELGGVLACRYDGRTKLSQLVLAELRRALPGKVFQTVIRENVRMRECPASGQSIMGFAPDSHAAQDYRALAKEILSEPERWRGGASHVAGAALTFNVDDLRGNAAASLAASRRHGTPAGHRPASLAEPTADDQVLPESLAREIACLDEAERRLAEEAEAEDQATGASGAAEATASGQPCPETVTADLKLGQAEQERPVNILEFLYDPQAEERVRQAPDEGPQGSCSSQPPTPAQCPEPGVLSTTPAPAWRDEPPCSETPQDERQNSAAEHEGAPAPEGDAEGAGAAADPASAEDDYADLRAFLEQAGHGPEGGDPTTQSGKDSAGLKGLIRKVFTK